jgi:hypothetical protein
MDPKSVTIAEDKRPDERDGDDRGDDDALAHDASGS